MLAVDLLRDERAMGAGLLDDALGGGDQLLGLFGFGIDVGPLEHLMTASVRYNRRPIAFSCVLDGNLDTAYTPCLTRLSV